MKTVILALTGVLVASRVFAQVADLDTLRGKYGVVKAQIEADCGKAKETAKVGYGNALAAAVASYKKGGNLDAYLAADKAKKQFDVDGKIPEDGGVDLVGAVRAYGDAVKKADADVLAKTYSLNRNYAAQLEPLIKQFMQADSIDDAKRVKDELDKIKFEIADAETKLPTQTTDKPDEPAVATGIKVVSSLVLSTTDKPDKGYDLVAKWSTDSSGGVATDGKSTQGNLYLFMKKESAVEAITDVVLYNAGGGNAPNVGTPEGYANLGHWDCLTSTDSFGIANNWNVSLCVKKGTTKPVMDVILGTESGLQRKGYVKRGSFNGMTLWVKYSKISMPTAGNPK